MLLPSIQNRRLVLASGSPRRQALIRSLGLPVEVRLKPVDEGYPDHLREGEIVRYLAEKKTEPFASELHDDELLLTGDTIVCLDKSVLNKPTNAEEALEMLTRLAGRTHKVISGVCLLSNQRRVVFSEETEVDMVALTRDELMHYIEVCRPFDKAGGYGIQELIGHIGISAIRGSYYNVVGFPIHRIYEELKGF